MLRHKSLLGAVIGLLISVAGCGGSDGDPASSSTSTSSNVGTLTSDVKVVNQSQASLVESQGGHDWVLRLPMDVNPGDVLLLDDAAVRVQAVTIQNGKTVLTVMQAEVQDVFAKFSIHQEATLAEAEFVPEPDNVGGTLQALSGSGATAAVSGSEQFHQSISYGPFSGDLDLTLNTKLDFDYDKTQDLTPHGKLDVTVKTNASILASFAGKSSRSLPEKSLVTIRMPISYTLLDAALKFLGVRLVSIQVPLTLGAEAIANGAVKVRLQGGTSSGVVVTYDKNEGLSTAPTSSAQFSVSGELPGEIPTTVAQGSVSLGPYLRAKPQLVILNKVASIGADIKAGIYAKGQLTSYLTAPFYCLNLQGVTAGEVFGFTRTIGANLKTQIFPNSANVGPPYVLGGQCQPSVEFSQAVYQISPPDTNATITVVLRGAVIGPVTVQYDTSDSTALSGRDYTATTGTLTFSPPETSKTFTVPILSNPASKGGKVKLALRQPSTGTNLGVQNTADLTINAASSVEFSLAAYTVEKAAGLVSIAVRRTGDVSRAATVHYATSDGTARAGQDYTSKSGILTFAAFDSATGFDIPILNNPNTQVDRTVNLTLSQPVGAALGIQSAAVLTILSSGPTVTIRGSCRFDGIFEATDAYTVGLAGSANGPVGFIFQVVNVAPRNRVTFMTPKGPLPDDPFIDCGSWTPISDPQWPGCRSNGTQTNWALQASITGDPAQHSTPIPFMAVGDLSSSASSFSRVDICPPYISGG